MNNITTASTKNVTEYLEWYLHSHENISLLECNLECNTLSILMEGNAKRIER